MVREQRFVAIGRAGADSEPCRPVVSKLRSSPWHTGCVASGEGGAGGTRITNKEVEALKLIANRLPHRRQTGRPAVNDPEPRLKGEQRVVTTRKEFCRVERFCRAMAYGTLGTACIAALIAALAIPDKYDLFEAQIAAVYLVLLVGSNKAFNAKSIYGRRSLGAFAAFTGTGLLPATIIHVAIAQIEPGQTAHLGTVIGYVMVGGLSAVLALMPSCFAAKIWQNYEKKHNQHETKTVPD